MKWIEMGVDMSEGICPKGNDQAKGYFFGNGWCFVEFG